MTILIHFQSNKSIEDVIKEEQVKRHQTLQRVCALQHLPLYKTKWMMFKKYDYTLHIIVDDEYKILFNYIPKVSCTAWKQLFLLLRARYSNSVYRRLEEYTDEEIWERLNTYTKVLFVREPITRLLSAYLSKFQSPTDLKTQKTWEKYYGKKIVETYRPSVNISDFDFEHELLDIQLDEVIHWITDMGSEINMDELRDHFLPMHRVANPCVIKYDFIGHYEDLAVEGPYVLRMLGIDHIVHFPPVHSSRAKETLTQLYQRVPLYLLQRLWDYYKLDYEMFGYSINDTMNALIDRVFFDDELA